MDISTKTFTVALPLVRSVYATPPHSFSDTSSPLGVSAILAEISALAKKIKLKVNTRRCSCWPGLRPDASSTLPILLPLLAPEGPILLLVPSGQARFMQSEIDTLLERLANMSEELVEQDDENPHVVVILQRFCIGSRLTSWLHPLPLYRRAYLAERNDRLSHNSVERTLHGFCCSTPRHSGGRWRVQYPSGQAWAVPGLSLGQTI